MTMPRVAITVDQFWAKVPGGTATALARYLRAHRDLPTRARLVGVAAAHVKPLPRQFKTGLNVRHLPLPRPLLHDAWRTRRVPLPVSLVSGPVDLVHATTFAIPPTNKPLLVTVHDLAFLEHPEFFTERGNEFFRAGLDHTRREADRILVPSEATFEECLAAGLPGDRMQIVPWGVDQVEVSASQVERVRRRHKLRRDYVLWVGTLEPRKNLAGLLAAFASVESTLKDYDLVIVGPKGWGDALGSGRKPAPERVKTLGYVSDSDLTALYAGARAFAYPSLSEGFGLPVLEAIATGTPVVTSIGTPMARLIGDAGVAVNPRDIASLANGLVAVTGNDHTKFAKAAKAQAEQFTWEATAAATDQVYRELA